MRVVGGSARGKKLQVVPGRGTRPIMDRVKSSLFDILRPRIAGSDMLDLFAGSGSVGIEALSQGAASCTFIENRYPAIVTIKQNLGATGLADRAEVWQTDAFDFLKKATKTFDLVYVAPPQYKDLWSDAMHHLDARPELLRLEGQIIVQIHPKEYRDLDLGTLHETRQRRYGNTVLVFYSAKRGQSTKRGQEPKMES